MASIRIRDREINNFGTPYILAELSANHLGSYGRAQDLVSSAWKHGADAIKIQCYEPGDMTLDCDGPEFMATGEWSGMRLWDLYSEAQTPRSWWNDLCKWSRLVGLDVIASLFNPARVPELTPLVDAFKIASFELNYTQLLEAVAASGKPVILSTGMATREEVKEALAVLGPDTQVAILHCTSAYPAKSEDAALGAIPCQIFCHNVPVGLSDHTLAPVVPPTAVALGACIIEKHFTLSRADGGSDAAFSLEPAEFAGMAAACREARRSIGSKPNDGDPDAPRDSEKDMARLRRSLFVSQDVRAGEMFTADNVAVIRPGYGLPPSRLPEVLGTCAMSCVARGTPLKDEHVGCGDTTQRGHHDAAGVRPIPV